MNIPICCGKVARDYNRVYDGGRIRIPFIGAMPDRSAEYEALRLAGIEWDGRLRA